MGRQAWWEEAPRNICGAAHALTAVSQLRPRGTWAVRAYFKLGRTFPALGNKLRALSFIHAARWTIVEDWPGHGKLKSPVLLFESNFNGDWGQYIDAFAYVIPERMSGVWATSWGWPGPKPAGPFKSYIRRNEQTALHYYAAYPEATVTEILASLQLQEAYGRFQERTRGMTRAEFDRAWSELMDEVQPWL